MKILISGGGIAGLAAAIFLHKAGHELKVIDKAASFQKLGYGISLKGFGIQIMHQLGLLEELQSHALSLSFFNIYNSKGKLIRSLPKKTVDEITGGTIPLSRADLHGVLYSAAEKLVPIEFGVQINGITHLSEKELVSFNNDLKDNFDLVIIAEGLRSKSRQLLWGDKGLTPLDITYVAAIIDEKHQFPLDEAVTFKGIGKTISCFPVSENQIVIQALVNSGIKSNSQNSFKSILIETFSDFPIQVVQLLSAINPKDYIFHDSVAMIELSELAQERVVLLGDAGYCPSSFSGMGASLSLLGAKILSESLLLSPHIKEALMRYNNLMHPIGLHFQNNARSTMKNELPQNKIQASIFSLILRYIPVSLIAKSVGKRLSVEKELLENSN